MHMGIVELPRKSLRYLMTIRYQVLLFQILALVIIYVAHRAFSSREKIKYSTRYKINNFLCKTIPQILEEVVANLKELLLKKQPAITLAS